jgi:hypothetical protein
VLQKSSEESFVMKGAGPAVLLAGLTLACLLPFLGKAIHIDDPLFVWTAQHIRSHPLDFYGFTVDWGLGPTRMCDEMKNPPLAAYYLAAVGGLLGWSEPALHFGFLLPAVTFIVGIFFLARQFCGHPFAVGLTTLAAPVFLLCATSLMCDTMMMAFWVWAAYFWREGMERKSAARLAAGGLFIAASSLTKYFGACLIPLLIFYSLAQERRAGVWLIYLCIPVLILTGYQWLTRHLYGQGLVASAAIYAAQERVGGGLGTKFFEGLAFIGGCLLVPLAAAPLLLGRKGRWTALAGVAAVALLIVARKKIGGMVVLDAGGVKWLAVAQLAGFVIGGAIVLTLAALDLVRNKSPDSLFLFLWIAGTFVFVVGVNWTVSGRNILPMVPPVALVLIRRLEACPQGLRYFWYPLGGSLMVALLATRADFQLADSARRAAMLVNQSLPAHAGPVYFEGHWGFQYYMEQSGAKPLVLQPLRLTHDQIIVLPLLYSSQSLSRAETLGKVSVSASPWISLIDSSAGAGFYSDNWGPAPYIFGPTKAQEYAIVKVK